MALSPGGRLNVGIYRVINYGGALSNPAALTLGTLPTGADRADYFIQTSVDKQVNLAYTNGLKLNYWERRRRNTAMSMAAPVSGWRQAASTTAGPIPPARSMRPGARTPSRFSPARAARFWSIAPPMGRSTRKPQFAVDGYVLQGNGAGDKLTLMGTSPGGGGPDEAVIRVGAGSADGAGYTAAISAVLDGTVRLVKTDLGALVLSGPTPTPAARPSTAARCRSRGTRTWASRRARRWLAAR